MVQSSSPASLLAIASSVLLASVNAHMTMQNPRPYGGSALTNSPISDANMYPCNLPGGSDWEEPSEPNVYAIGEAQTLSFKGSAVHGGGSCQISLTTDKKPTAQSKWQVIHSIMGGCPASAAGNLEGGQSPSTFQFKIPEGIAAGDYTLSWSWFNKIGNREMYMNCAPVTVTGAKKKRYAPSTPAEKRQTSFPDMAVANLAFINGCKTTETKDVQFADPGPSSETAPGANLAPFTGDNCPFIGGGSGSSGSGSGSGSSGSGNAPSPTAAVSQTTPGVFAPSSTAAPSAPAVAPTSATVEPAPTSAAAPSSGSSGSGSGSNATGSSAQGASCSVEGSSECAADGQSYTICASGYWQKMPVAAGTKCSGSGIQANVNIIATKPKRHVHAREHIRRKHI